MQDFKSLEFCSFNSEQLRKSALTTPKFVRFSVTDHSFPFWGEEEECRTSGQMFLQAERTII